MFHAKLCLDILGYMIQMAVSNGRVGQSVPLSDHRKALGCPESTYYRAVKTLKESGMLQQYGRDRYSIGSWAIDIAEMWGKD